MGIEVRDMCSLREKILRKETDEELIKDIKQMCKKKIEEFISKL